MIGIASREIAFRPKTRVRRARADERRVRFPLYLSSRGGTVQLRRSVNGQWLMTMGQCRRKERQSNVTRETVPEYHYLQLLSQRRHPVGQMLHVVVARAYPVARKTNDTRERLADAKGERKEERGWHLARCLASRRAITRLFVGGVP